MNLQFASDFLLWCLIINYAVLLLWFGVFVFAHDWLLNLHRRWFHLSEDGFDTAHYLGMAIYKIGILLLNFVPYVVVRILASRAS